MLNALIFFVLPFFPLIAGQNQAEKPVVIEGKTMGTTYRIIYFDSPGHRNFKSEVDSLLARINMAINTYDPASEISRFNQSDKGICLELPYLYEILKKAKTIHRSSDRAFDPTVMPLVNAWGFGPVKSAPPSATQIDSLRLLTGFDKVKFSKKRVTKKNPEIQLDMGGIGQGYGADIIFRFLKSKGIRDMLVELGGEGLTLGKNLEKNKAWTIGILDPNSTPGHQFFKAIVTLGNRAFTTSGNYFNYRIVDGQKYGHTVDPSTGYPVQHTLLSASVFAPECTTADGWATAFMVMGVEKAIAKAMTLKDIDVLFIYSTENGDLETYMSPGLEKNVVLE